MTIASAKTCAGDPAEARLGQQRPGAACGVSRLAGEIGREQQQPRRARHDRERERDPGHHN